MHSMLMLMHSKLIHILSHKYVCLTQPPEGMAAGERSTASSPWPCHGSSASPLTLSLTELPAPGVTSMLYLAAWGDRLVHAESNNLWQISSTTYTWAAKSATSTRQQALYVPCLIINRGFG